MEDQAKNSSQLFLLSSPFRTEENRQISTNHEIRLFAFLPDSDFLWQKFFGFP
jgi:hypothetical protein